MDVMSAVAGITAESAASKKRSGRPCIGGRGESWDKLLACFQEDAAMKTKNGLPGVPYALKSMLAHLKYVWTSYVPDVDIAIAPTEWRWLADKAPAITERIVKDVYSTGVKFKYLAALAQAVKLLGRRTSSVHVTDAEAPVGAFTAEVHETYAAASKAAAPPKLHPAPTQTQNFVKLSQLRELHAYVRKLRVAKETGSETARLYGWADVVFSVSLYDTPLNMYASAASAKLDLLNTLVMDHKSHADPAVPTPAADVAKHNTISGDRSITLRRGVDGAPVVWTPKEEDGREALDWAWRQRAEGADHLERFLPRRLSVDHILKRMCRTAALKKIMGGRVLTSELLRTAYVTAAFESSLDALHASVDRLRLHAVDPLLVLSHGLYPRTLGIDRDAIAFPPAITPASELLVDAPPTV
jgi:hypothetical protein